MGSETDKSKEERERERERENPETNSNDFCDLLVRKMKINNFFFSRKAVKRSNASQTN
jgi:hypothetical protein